MSDGWSRNRHWLAGDDELCRSRGGRALVGRRLSGRCPMDRETKQRRTGTCAMKSRPSFRPLLADALPGVPPSIDLRRPRLLNAGRAESALARGSCARQGFDAFGVARPDAIPEAQGRLAHSSPSGGHGDMDWLADAAARAAIRAALWPDVRSVIMLGMNYGPGPRSAGDACASATAARSRSMRRATTITS